MLYCFELKGFISFGCVYYKETSTKTHSIDKIYVVKEPLWYPVHVQHTALV